MAKPLTDPELRAIRNSVNLVGRLSDNIIHMGPFSIGLDGVLSWIPGLGEIYSAAAGGFILVQGLRAGVPYPTLVGAAALLGLRTVITGAPLAGAAFSDLFTAHKWAAGMIVSAIDEKLRAGPSPSGFTWSNSAEGAKA
jgi:hypothetical protein